MMQKKLNKIYKNEKGFTLMEMLIVVAIIAILVAIAFPIFNEKLEESRKATNVANIRTAISVATNQYLSDNKSGEGKYSYSIPYNKLFDADADKFAESENLAPNRSQKTGLFGGTCVLIDPDDQGAPIKTYPYINENGDIVFEKQGEADWPDWGGTCDAMTFKYAYGHAGVNHFDALTNNK